MKKTDESVKAGLAIEAGTKPKDTTAKTDIPEVENEKDADELAHERAAETPDVTNEQDMDELVHKIPPAETGIEKEVDGDDAVHGG